MKVRILTDGNNYTIQYAELSNTTDFTEVIIAKDSNYNLTAFSLTTGQTVSVEPEVSQWDIDFGGVFSYYGTQGGLNAGLTFSDYTLHNTLGGVGLYQLDAGTNGVPSYTDFTISNIDDSALVYDNRAVIGSGWRSVSFIPGVPPTLRENRYYILKDAAGNYYKLRFTAFANAEGERGNPQFTYELL